MIRTKTTLVVGSAAGAEVDLPDRPDLLARLVQSLDFSRLGSDLQTDEISRLSGLVDAFAAQSDTEAEHLKAAAERVRVSARVADSFDLVLEQHAHDKHAMAILKLGMVMLTLQAEARSPLKKEPLIEGELPLRGTENWLFQLGRLITAGVPRSKAEACFDNLAVVSFCRDRSLEHFLPFMVSHAFGMTLEEAQALVGEKLNVTHPLGSTGRLPWEPGKLPLAEWGEESDKRILKLRPMVDSVSERMQHDDYLTSLRKAVGGSQRLVFIGFDFHPLDVGFLFGGNLEKQPDVLASAYGRTEAWQLAVTRMLQDRAGLRPDKLGLLDMRPFELLREFNLFLES